MEDDPRLNQGTAALLLDLSRDRARGVRDTADTINVKLSWLLAYLGVLLVAVVQDWTGIHDSTALPVLLTGSLAMIVISAGAALWAMKMETLRGIAGSSWLTTEEARRNPEDVAFDMATTILREADADMSEGGAIPAIKQRYLVARIAAGATTIVCCSYLVTKVWLI